MEIEDLKKKAEYVRRKIEKLLIPWLGQGYINTTVSIGIAMADHYIKN